MATETIRPVDPNRDVWKTDHEARCYVCGMVNDPKLGWIVHTGHWHERFRGHPLVKQAVAEGWSNELCSVVVAAIARRMRRNFTDKEIIAEHLMPDAEWVGTTRIQATRYREGEASRAVLIEKYGSLDAALARIAHQPLPAKKDAFSGVGSSLGAVVRNVLKQREFGNIEKDEA